MKKNLNMIGFFSRIALAVLSFAIIVCIFLPYMRIPAVDVVQNVDTVNKTLKRRIGLNQFTFNISEFTSSTCPAFELYEDEALEKTVNKSEVPLPEQVNTYYFATYAYGYTSESTSKEPEKILLEKYTVTITKDTVNDSKVSLTRDVSKKTISIRVPKATTFDFARVIDTKTAWLKQKSNMPQTFNEITSDIELRSIAIEEGGYFNAYVAICLKSEVDPYASLNGISEAESKQVYWPLEIYSLDVERDDTRRTLPTVGEIGGGLLSSAATNEANELTVSTKDTGMFAFMIAAAVSTLLALIIPNKFRIINVVISSATGLGLIIISILDMLFYTKWNFNIEVGFFVLIILGVLMIPVSVFDFIVSHKTYREELIHVYGEDYFDKEKRAAIRAGLKEKDKEYKVQMKDERAKDKEMRKVAKRAEKIDRKASRKK